MVLKSKKLWMVAIATGCLSASLTSVHAADPNPDFTACAAKANTTVAMEDCAKSGLADADRRLNLAYAKAMSSLPEDQQAGLRASQRTWLTFREQDCRVFTGRDAGSMAAPNFGNCKVDRTEIRIRDLAGFSSK